MRKGASQVKAERSGGACGTLERKKEAKAGTAATSKAVIAFSPPCTRSSPPVLDSLCNPLHGRAERYEGGVQYKVAGRERAQARPEEGEKGGGARRSGMSSRSPTMDFCPFSSEGQEAPSWINRCTAGNKGPAKRRSRVTRVKEGQRKGEGKEIDKPLSRSFPHPPGPLSLPVLGFGLIAARAASVVRHGIGGGGPSPSATYAEGLQEQLGVLQHAPAADNALLGGPLREMRGREGGE